MKLFIDKLIEKVVKKDSRVCVGLDPHLHLLPEFLINKYLDNNWEKDNQRLAAAVLEFNKKIIDNIKDIAVAVKPQIAFYELIGIKGLETLEHTIAYAKKQGLLVILDAKRNDIGSTAKAYAEAYFGIEKKENSVKNYIFKNITVDAMTINPYLGSDGIKPFLENNAKGAFALVRTSNSSAVELQDQELKNGKKIYEKVGELVSDWGCEKIGENGYSNLGAVIGATYPEELKILRKNMPHTYFLLPGYGFQGGSPEDIVFGFDKDKQGAIINSSRGIIFAFSRKPFSGKYKEQEYGKAAREAVINMKKDINNALNQ